MCVYEQDWQVWKSTAELHVKIVDDDVHQATAQSRSACLWTGAPSASATSTHHHHSVARFAGLAVSATVQRRYSLQRSSAPVVRVISRRYTAIAACRGPDNPPAVDIGVPVQASSVRTAAELVGATRQPNVRTRRSARSSLRRRSPGDSLVCRRQEHSEVEIPPQDARGRGHAYCASADGQVAVAHRRLRAAADQPDGRRRRRRRSTNRGIFPVLALLPGGRRTRARRVPVPEAHRWRRGRRSAAAYWQVREVVSRRRSRRRSRATERHGARAPPEARLHSRRRALHPTRDELRRRSSDDWVKLDAGVRRLHGRQRLGATQRSLLIVSGRLRQLAVPPSWGGLGRAGLLRSRHHNCWNVQLVGWLSSSSWRHYSLLCRLSQAWHRDWQELPRWGLLSFLVDWDVIVSYTLYNTMEHRLIQTRLFFENQILTRKRDKAQPVARPACANATVHFLCCTT